MDGQCKIKLILQEMEKEGIDAYIIPSSDPHASEYLPEHYKTRQWVSGFTGSAGTLVITRETQGLWTDGRYYIQAAKELEGTGIELFKAAEPNVPSFKAWLANHLEENATIAFNGFQMMTQEVKDILHCFEDKKVQINHTANLVDKLWLNRPYIPCEKVYLHDVMYAGETTHSKLSRIKEAMKAHGANCHLITKLDDIAWILNLRGSDIDNNPYFLSYLFISEEETLLYIDPLKLNDEIIEYLHKNDVKVKLYEDLEDDIEALTRDQSVLAELPTLPYQFYKSMEGNCKIIGKTNPSTLFKAVKNATEIETLKECYRKDGVAMVKFLHWLDTHIGKMDLTEVTVAEELKTYRESIEEMRGTSFDTICGYRDHGAIMHYHAEPESAYKLEAKGLLLVDSGGQYLTGTTDVTRTVALGALTEQERFDYTLNYKCTMALSRAIFLEGATGTHLDTIARMQMWENAMDYKSGTGHGVGFHLGVHEGPQRISMNLSDARLVPGMVVTNEPGVYRAGMHGIRLEDTLVVVPYMENEFGRFFRFENLTKVPMDLRAIDLNRLSDKEKLELRDYQHGVYDALHRDLSAEEAAWLKGMIPVLA